MIDSLLHYQTSCCSTNIAVATWRITFWLTPGILYTSQWFGRCPHNAFFPGGSRPSPNTRFLGSTRVHVPNGISIGSAVLAQIMVVTNGHRHRHSSRYICSNRPNNNCRCRALCSSCIIVVINDKDNHYNIIVIKNHQADMYKKLQQVQQLHNRRRCCLTSRLCVRTLNSVAYAFI